MKILLTTYAAALGATVVLDGLWLGLMGRAFYKAHLGDLLLDRPIWSVAIFFYLIHPAGIAVFAVPPAGSWLGAALYGAFFGFCVYAVYDITNLATIPGWPAVVSLVDLAWGTVVSAIATTFAFAVVRAIHPA